MLLAAIWGPWWLGAILAALPIGVALFFRDPERSSPADSKSVLAPADGKVMHVGDAHADEAPPGQWKQITIFLSLFDVHINRTPVSGKVTRVDYHAGTFLPAYRHDAFKNERSEIWVDHNGVAVVTQ